MVVFEGNFSYPGVPCRMVNVWCVVDVPTVGSLAFLARNPEGLSHTVIAFRLVPKEGVTVAWSSTDITLVDLDANKSMQVKALDTKPVTGRQLAGNIAEEHWVLYGPYSPGELGVHPRIAKMEVRVPPIFRGAQMFQIPPLRINDGPRIPKLFFWIPWAPGH
jgi:hypothetical protein